MDQYLGVDLRDRKGEPAHALHRLHHKLYAGGQVHVGELWSGEAEKLSKMAPAKGASQV